MLCGHTHSGSTYDPLPNLHVITGGATYGEPAITGWFEVEQLALVTLLR